MNTITFPKKHRAAFKPAEYLHQTLPALVECKRLVERLDAVLTEQGEDLPAILQGWALDDLRLYLRDAAESLGNALAAADTAIEEQHEDQGGAA